MNKSSAACGDDNVCTRRQRPTRSLIAKDHAADDISAPVCPGSYDAFLNVQIAIVILFQVLLCVGLACGSLGWRNNSGYERSHLQFRVNDQGNYKSNIVYVIVLWITYWILLSYLVPISLFVTMEIVKFLMVSPWSLNCLQMLDTNALQYAYAAS